MSSDPSSSVLAHAPVAIVTLRDDGSIASANDAALEIFEAEASQVIGSRIATWLPGVDWRAAEQATRERARNADRSHAPNVQLTRVEIGGESLRIVAISSAEALDRATRKVEEQRAEIAALLYAVSHDLREPLRSVRSFSGLLSRRYADNLDDRGRDFLARIEGGCDRLDKLIHGVLDLSRAGRQIAPTERVSVGPIVEAMILRASKSSTPSGARIEIVGDLGEVYADRAWLQRVLQELIDNALKFVKPDQPPQVEVSRIVPPPNRRGAVGFVVRDRGSGVPQNAEQRVFELFQRTVPGSVPGVGAGLAVVRTVARCHGGDAWLSARDGGGTEVFFTISDLPAEEPL